MVNDYSKAVHKYTLLDAYPMPNIECTFNHQAPYKYFSTIDLKNAYYQIPLYPNDRSYTTFQSGGQLYQFTIMPFGMTNGTACFQRKMDEYFKERVLQNTYHIYQPPPLGQDMTPGQFFKRGLTGFNSSPRLVA